MRTLPVQLCAMAIFATMALGQDAAEDTEFPSDATLAEKLKEASEAPAVVPAPVTPPAGVAAQTAPATPSTKPRVTFTDEPALEPGPELHIGTGSVAWNSMLKKSDAERALQEAREKREIYRNIAAGGTPIVKPRTASEFLAANPPTPVPVSDVVQQRSSNMLEVRASGASQFNRTPTARNNDVPQFTNPQVRPPTRKSRPKFLSFLKPKSEVEATPEDFENPYSMIPPASYPEGPEPLTEGQTPAAVEPNTIDALITEATAGADPAPPAPQPAGNSNGGGFFKKIFGKRPAPQPGTISDPLPPVPGTLPPGSAPPVPADSDDDLDFDIPAPPSDPSRVDSPVAPSVEATPVQ